MARTRRYHPHVADDLSAAVSYYDEISVDLGNRFRVSLRHLFATITDRPDSYGRIQKELRVAMVHRFPYIVLFEHEIESVSILGVFHAASDRTDWFTRSL